MNREQSKKLMLKSGGGFKVIENALNDSSNREAFSIIKEMRTKGKSSFQTIANTLNSKSIKTRRGKLFSRGSVKNLFDRFSVYYDFEKNAFKEGEIPIQIGDDIILGQLKVLEKGEIYIQTHLNNGKAIQFFKTRKDIMDENRNKAVIELEKSILSAEKKIIVSYYIHLNPKNPQLTNEVDLVYFKNLENRIKEKKLKYIRALQIPFQIWKEIRTQKVTISNNFPIESIITVCCLLPKRVTNHILRCIKYLDKDCFKLYIYRIERTRNTFATIDDHTLIEENFITDIQGKARPYEIRITKNSKDNEDIKRLVQSRIDTVLELQFAECSPQYRESIDWDLFKCIFNLFLIFEHGITKEEFIQNNHIKDFKNLTEGSCTVTDLYEKINGISTAITNLRKEIEDSIDIIPDNTTLMNKLYSPDNSKENTPIIN